METGGRASSGREARSSSLGDECGGAEDSDSRLGDASREDPTEGAGVMGEAVGVRCWGRILSGDLKESEISESNRDRIERYVFDTA